MALAQSVCTACTSSSEIDGTKGTWVSEEDFRDYYYTVSRTMLYSRHLHTIILLNNNPDPVIRLNHSYEENPSLHLASCISGSHENAELQPSR